MMSECKECQKNPVIILSESQKLCKSHFLKYFEGKVIKTIKKYGLIEKKDRLAVAVSGGKDSIATLHIINQFLKPQKREVIAILVDEGIKGYREKTIKDAQAFCKKEQIPLIITSFKDEFGKTLDQIVKSQSKKKGQEKMNACAYCGVFRRVLLNNAAKELGITKIATGHNLDDEAQSILMNQLKVNWKRSAGLGPISGINVQKTAQRIKPLYFLPEKEVATYAYLMKFGVKFTQCPYSHESFRGDVRDMINGLEEKHPGSKHSIVNSLMNLLPILKEKYKEGKFGYCKICHEPSSKEICNSCQLIERLNLNDKIRTKKELNKSIKKSRLKKTKSRK